MRRITKVAVLAVSIAFVGAQAVSAMAETTWERNHPRRDQVNDRIERQERRIAQERREGEITARQAQHLRNEDRQILREERIAASHDGGHITIAEQRALNQQIDRVSRQIGK